MSACLGAVAAALVDGELDHGARERALHHLSHCIGCRAEVEAERRLKASLVGLSRELAPPPPRSLEGRLRALAMANVDSMPLDDRRAVTHPGSVRPVSIRPAPRGGSAVRPGRRSVRRLPRRAVTGSALAVAGVAAAFVLGSPPARPASTPVDPGTDAFVTMFVDTSVPGTAVPAQQAGLLRVSGGGTGR